MASDGSAPAGQGAFAWVISDRSGNRLIRCSGPAFGYAISSYQSESYGIASILRFLVRMTMIYHTTQDIWSHTLYCDNQGLVKRINKLMTYPTIFPNSTMEPEWDCLAQILDSLKFLQHHAPSIHHVKGHQDEETPYEQLPLNAQVNCDAD